MIQKFMNGCGKIWQRRQQSRASALVLSTVMKTTSFPWKQVIFGYQSIKNSLIHGKKKMHSWSFISAWLPKFQEWIESVCIRGGGPKTIWKCMLTSLFCIYLAHFTIGICPIKILNRRKIPMYYLNKSKNTGENIIFPSNGPPERPILRARQRRN